MTCQPQEGAIPVLTPSLVVHFKYLGCPGVWHPGSVDPLEMSLVSFTRPCADLQSSVDSRSLVSASPVKPSNVILFCGETFKRDEELICCLLFAKSLYVTFQNSSLC